MRSLVLCLCALGILLPLGECVVDVVFSLLEPTGPAPNDAWPGPGLLCAFFGGILLIVVSLIAWLKDCIAAVDVSQV